MSDSGENKGNLFDRYVNFEELEANLLNLNEEDLPVRSYHCGNGHFDVVAEGSSKDVGHAYCWSEEDFNKLEELIEKTNNGD